MCGLSTKCGILHVLLIGHLTLCNIDNYKYILTEVHPWLKLCQNAGTHLKDIGCYQGLYMLDCKPDSQYILIDFNGQLKCNAFELTVFFWI